MNIDAFDSEPLTPDEKAALAAMVGRVGLARVLHTLAGIAGEGGAPGRYVDASPLDRIRRRDCVAIAQLSFLVEGRGSDREPWVVHPGPPEPRIS
jgi:hypothetical protein